MSTISHGDSPVDSVPSLDELNGNAPGVRTPCRESVELPGFNDWLRETGQDEITDEDLDAMWVEEQERRDLELPTLQPVTVGVRRLNPDVWGKLG